jgi:hypothetical protein
MLQSASQPAAIDYSSIAILIALAFTCLLAIIEVTTQSKAKPRECWSWSLAFYTAIMVVGNMVATLIASILLEGKLPVSLLRWAPLFWAFLGVFAFQYILSHTNIRVFDQGVLTIQDWITKAREGAIAEAIANNARADNTREIKNTQLLVNSVTDEDLNIYIATYLGEETATRLQGENRPKRYKALLLASDAPEMTAAILKAHANLKTHASQGS